jgi:hypothetical protein
MHAAIVASNPTRRAPTFPDSNPVTVMRGVRARRCSDASSPRSAARSRRRSEGFAGAQANIPAPPLLTRRNTTTGTDTGGSAARRGPDTPSPPTSPEPRSGSSDPSAIIGSRARATARPTAGMTPQPVAPGTFADQIREPCQT